MTTAIDMDQLRKDAVEIFNAGFACSESVIYAIRKNFEIDLSDDAIAMSSGFPWGLGGGGCICGALAGGTMCLGYFFGRKTPAIPKLQNAFSSLMNCTIILKKPAVLHAVASLPEEKKKIHRKGKHNVHNLFLIQLQK